MRLTGIPLNQPRSPKQDTPFPQEDHRVRFHKDYPKVAEEYDKESSKIRRISPHRSRRACQHTNGQDGLFLVSPAVRTVHRVVVPLEVHMPVCWHCRFRVVNKNDHLYRHISVRDHASSRHTDIPSSHLARVAVQRDLLGHFPRMLLVCGDGGAPTRFSLRCVDKLYASASQVFERVSCVR